jgi:cytochrome c oxidase subunit 3
VNAVAAERFDAEGRRAAAETLVFILLASGAMLFAAFTASYLIRRTGSDWGRIALPPLAWATAAVLVASSVTMELARRRASPWLGATLLLGLLFAAGQAVVWRQMAARGVFLPSSPHASFFYMLTGVHFVHVAAGLVALWAARAGRVRTGLVAAWWHFVDGLWIYVLLMLWIL